MFEEGFEPDKAFKALLQPQDRAADRPFGQGAGAAEIGRQLPDQIAGPVAGEQHNRCSIVPYLDRVPRRIGEIEHAVPRCRAMHCQPARGEERRLRKIGVVVIAARHRGFVHDLRQVRGLVAADAGLAGPHRIASCPRNEVEREIAHLLAAAPDGFAGVGVDMQPKTVMRGIGCGDGDTVGVQRHARDVGGIVAQHDRIAVAAPLRRRDRVMGRVIDAEIAAHHRHIRAPARNGHRWTSRAVAQHHVAATSDLEARIGC